MFIPNITFVLSFCVPAFFPSLQTRFGIKYLLQFEEWRQVFHICEILSSTNVKVMKLFLERLNHLRGDMNVTEFSRFLGMKQRTVDACLRGERKPSIELLLAICEKCNVTSDWMLGRSSQKTSTIVLKNDGVKEKVKALKKDAGIICEQADALLGTIAKMEEAL